MRKTEIQKQKAYKYYLKGLNSKEIGKLLDISFRTVQNYMTKGKWKAKRQPTNIKYETLRLYESGLTYPQIATELNISRASVYLYLKETRTFKEKQAKKRQQKV